MEFILDSYHLKEKKMEKGLYFIIQVKYFKVNWLMILKMVLVMSTFLTVHVTKDNLGMGLDTVVVFSSGAMEKYMMGSGSAEGRREAECGQVLTTKVILVSGKMIKLKVSVYLS